MGNLNPFLSKPGEWVEELARLKDDIKALSERESKLTDKLKAHMKERDIEVVIGDKHEFKRQTGERTDTSQKALAATFGDAWLDDAITKLPKQKTETFRLFARKAITPEARAIADYFGKKDTNEKETE